MKKTLAAVLAAISILSVSAYAADDIGVYLNGNEVYFADQKPVIISDRTLVPMRAVFEAMGAAVDWNGDTRTVTIRCAYNKTISLSIGSSRLLCRDDIKDKNIILDVPAQIVNDRTLVPLRAISESMGAQVDWDGGSRSVTIAYSGIEDNKNKTYLNGYYDGTCVYDEFYQSVPDVLNLGAYLEKAPYHSENGTYCFNTSGVSALTERISSYNADMRKFDFKLSSSGTTSVFIGNSLRVTLEQNGDNLNMYIQKQ